MLQPICTLFPYTTLFRSEALEQSLVDDLEEYCKFTSDLGFHSEVRLGLGTDVVLELRRLCLRVAQEFPRSEWNPRSRSEEHTSELQSLRHLVCPLLLEKKKRLGTTRRARSAPRARPADGRRGTASPPLAPPRPVAPLPATSTPVPRFGYGPFTSRRYRS